MGIDNAQKQLRHRYRERGFDALLAVADWLGSNEEWRVEPMEALLRLAAETKAAYLEELSNEQGKD
jgi:hypothetical protein